MKKAFLFVFALICLMTVLCVSVGAEVFEGKAVDEAWISRNEGSSNFEDGDISKIAPFYRIYYKLDTDEGVLRIFYKEKEQKMLPYARMEWVPWLKAEEPNVQRPYIQEAVIEEGVLTVGRYSFYECENLHTVYLPASIYHIDQTVFYQCPSLQKIYYPGTQEDFEKYVTFDKTRNEDALGKFIFGESVTVIAKNQHGEVIEEYIVGGYYAGESYSFLPKKYEGMTYTGDPTKAFTGVFAENDQTVIELVYECDHSYTSNPEEAACISRCKYCNRDNPNALHVFSEDGYLPCRGICLLCGLPYDNENGQHVLSCDPNAADAPCRYSCSQCNEIFENENGKHDIESLDESRSLFKGGQTGWKCKLCGANEIEAKNPIIFYVGIVAVAMAACTVIALAIILPIRRHKKIKEMTW